MGKEVKYMNMNRFAQEVHRNAVAHGWWDEERSFGEIVALCHSELSEALEEFRAKRPMLYFPCNAGGLCVDDRPEEHMDCGSRVIDLEHPEISCKARSYKPEGVAVELADCIIRILDWMGKEEISPDEYLERARSIRRVMCDLPAYLCKGSLGDLVAELHLYLSLAYRNWLDGSGISPVACRMALVILRIQEWAAETGVDMETILDQKHAYNKTRPYRHGGKAL